jgi:hypothetical protein
MSANDFTVEYKPGASHKVPDELSRMMTLGHSETPGTDEDDTFVPCLVIDTGFEENLLPIAAFGKHEFRSVCGLYSGLKITLQFSPNRKLTCKHPANSLFGKQETGRKIPFTPRSH